MTTITTTTHNAQLQDLVALLHQQDDLKYDVVAPAARLRYMGGNLHVEDGATRIADAGVDLAPAVLRPTEVFDGGIGERLAIPRRYVRRMRDEAVDLLDANVNHWLAADPSKRWFVRGFRTDDADDVGMARAFLSDSYRVADNLDVLMATLDGLRAAGTAVDVLSANLTESRMTVKVVAPEVQALAPVLLAGYRSPFDDTTPERWAQLERHGWLDGDDRPVVFAGFTVSNSETGGGAFAIAPHLTVRVCRNGMTVKGDALRSVHLGAKMDAGLVKWSDDTQQRNLQLVTAQARDAVATFLDSDYVLATVARLEQQAGAVVDNPVQAVERVSKVHQFTDAEQDQLLNHFLGGGQRTAGGMLNAVASIAQLANDPDRATELEELAIDTMVTAVAR